MPYYHNSLQNYGDFSRYDPQIIYWIKKAQLSIFEQIACEFQKKQQIEQSLLSSFCVF